jgi:phosphoribosylglycinamide formyltransferase-1
VVISNRADAPGLQKAAAGGIPTVTIESKPFGTDRAGFEAALQAALDRHRVELICLGGFMRLFTAEFVQRWYGKMLNIHPSLLPSFPGLDPHGQALRAGVKISGATVHFVIPETDAGPIVMQGAVAVRDDDTPETLSQRIWRSNTASIPRRCACSPAAPSGWRGMSARPSAPPAAAMS